MKNKRGLKLIYWTILLNPFLLALYVYGIRTFADLCFYGGVRRRLPQIAICAFLGILWLFLWTVIYFVKKKAGSFKTIVKKGLWIFVLCAEILVLAGTTAYYGKKIILSGQNYNGKLSWKIDELMNSRKIPLEHDHIFTDGIEGIFKDLETKTELPEELYLSNSFSLKFDKDGTITEIYSFFYGKNEQGQTKTFLLDYDRNKSDQMTVWLDGSAGSTYEEKYKMTSLFQLLEMADIEKETLQWQEIYGVSEFEIVYYGYRSFPTSEGIQVFWEDGGVGVFSSVQTEDGDYAGYEVSLHVPGREDIAPVRYMDGWNRLKTEKEHEPETVYEIGTSTRVQEDGSVYYFLDETLGWRLAVADAACGSRWYRLEKTEDGGNSWNFVETEISDEDFWGVAEAIQFYDENFGFVLMGSVSESHAELYMTKDGGLTFKEIKLPKEQVTKAVESLEEYDFTTMPVRKGNLLKTTLRLEKYDCPSILFESEDEGETWNYVGISEE